MAVQTERDDGVWSTRAKLAFAVFAVIGAFFLIAEHRAHVLPYLPWLFLAACPLMHFFMHGGHGSHERHHGHGDAAADHFNRKRSSGSEPKDTSLPASTVQEGRHRHDGCQP